MKLLMLGVVCLLFTFCSCNNASKTTKADSEQESKVLFDQLIKLHYQSLQQENNREAIYSVDSILNITTNRQKLI